MSQLADGSFVCDSCGYDVVNGGLQYCVIVLDEGPADEGYMRKYHFCRAHEGSTGREVKGCGEKMLGNKMLAHFNEGVTKKNGPDGRPAAADSAARPE